MKFVTSQSAILKSLTLVLGGISSKIAEHSMVKIKADKSLNTVTFETRNLDVKIKSFLALSVEEAGEISIELIKLLEVIKKLNQSQEILFKAKDSNLNITNGSSKFLLKGASTWENNEKEGKAKASFKLMSKKLLSLIDKTKFSIYPDETRFNLNGLSFQLQNREDTIFLKSISTDGHRLSVAEIETSITDASHFPKIILPKKATLEIKKVLESIEDEEIEIELLENQIAFSTQSFKFISKLIDAEFPDYEKVIPLENNKVFIIPRKELISLTERVGAIYTGSSQNGIKLFFQGSTLTASAKEKEDASDASDELTLEEPFDGQLEVNYNYNYLIEILNHISSDKIKLCLKDEKTPAILKDEKLDSYLYILMPMRF